MAMATSIVVSEAGWPWPAISPRFPGARLAPGRCSHLSEVMSRLFAAAWGATPAGCRLLYSAGDPTERAESWLRELPYGNGH